MPISRLLLKSNSDGILSGEGFIKMIIIKILAGTIFILLGVLVLYKGIRTTRLKGSGGFIEIATGIGFVIIGLLIWLGFIS